MNSTWSRRQFARALAGAALLSTPSKTTSAEPARKRLIVDAQVHLWKAESADWKWIPGAKPQMPAPFTIEKLLPLMDESSVDRAVIVPPSWPGDRNDYALEAATRFPKRFGVMGRIALQSPRSADLLPKWREQPGLLGVRLTLAGASFAWLGDGTADWFWPAAAKAKIPVMVFTGGRSSALASIADAHPDLILIVDHMGVTADLVREGKLKDAIDQTASLARFQNVSVKLSGVPNFSLEKYPFRDFLPHLQKLFDAFGPRRCHWGTDLTNGFEKATYRQRITHFTEELSFLSEADKDWIMGRSIIERLRWT